MTRPRPHAGLAKDLNTETRAGGPFASLYGKIANWNRVS